MPCLLLTINTLPAAHSTGGLSAGTKPVKVAALRDTSPELDGPFDERTASDDAKLSGQEPDDHLVAFSRWALRVHHVEDVQRLQKRNDIFLQERKASFFAVV